MVQAAGDVDGVLRAPLPHLGGAAMLPAVMSEAASCIPKNTGLSSVARPYRWENSPKMSSGAPRTAAT